MLVICIMVVTYLIAHLLQGQPNSTELTRTQHLDGLDVSAGDDEVRGEERGQVQICFANGLATTAVENIAFKHQ